MFCLNCLGKPPDVTILELDIRISEALPEFLFHSPLRGTVLVRGDTLNDCLNRFQLLIDAHATNLGMSAPTRIFVEFHRIQRSSSRLACISSDSQKRSDDTDSSPVLSARVTAGQRKNRENGSDRGEHAGNTKPSRSENTGPSMCA